MTTTDGAPEVWRVECEGGEAREVAETILFLCSQASSYINGAEIHINGGQHV